MNMPKVVPESRLVKRHLQAQGQTRYAPSLPRAHAGPREGTGQEGANRISNEMTDDPAPSPPSDDVNLVVFSAQTFREIVNHHFRPSHRGQQARGEKGDFEFLHALRPTGIIALVTRFSFADRDK